MKKTILVVAIITMLGVSVVNADTFYVPADFNNIQAAINASDDGDEVVISKGTYTGDGNRDIDFFGKAITVRSTDPNDPNVVAATIIDCNGTEAEPHRGFYFDSSEDVNLVINGLTIINGYERDGGAIYVGHGSPSFINCIFKNNQAVREGGAVSYRGGDLVLLNCKFENNQALRGGGAVYIGEYRSSLVTNCIFKNNQAVRGGGAVYIGGYRSPLFTNCIFENNRTIKDGGAVYIEHASPLFANCIFGNNQAKEHGGAIFCDHDNSTLLNCKVNDNSAEFGGGISCDNSNLSINDSIISRNSTTAGDGWISGGGGISCLSYSNLSINNSVISHNSATDDGGGIYSWQNSKITINDSIISQNQVTGEHESHGAGIYSDLTNLNINNSKIIGNTLIGAHGYGAGIFHISEAFVEDLSCIISECTISENIVKTGDSNHNFGGGICIMFGSAVVRQCKITGNSAKKGSGIFNPIFPILTAQLHR